MTDILIVAAMLQQVNPQRLRSDVETLAVFHTRNTLSQEIEKATEWLAEQYRKIPNVEVEIMRYTLPKGRRVPEERVVSQVIAKIKGETGKVIIVGGHLDSLNLQADSVNGRSPGANDDASGTVLALEVARIMSQKKWKHTLVFVGFTGEEQGLHGSRALAKKAKSENWDIMAVLNNDTVGSSQNKVGQSDTKRVRVFSEENENHQSRELARFIEWLTSERNEEWKNQQKPDFGIKLVLRRDRFGRGGDHIPFAEEGYAAVRFIEVFEEYTRQHTEDDLPQYMDWNYLANVTRMNLIAMAALANAGEPPKNVRIRMEQSHDTTLTWDAEPAIDYVVYWRETTSAVWEGAIRVGKTNTHTLSLVNKDDHIFAVGAAGGVPVLAR